MMCTFSLAHSGLLGTGNKESLKNFIYAKVRAADDSVVRTFCLIENGMDSYKKLQLAELRTLQAGENVLCFSGEGLNAHCHRFQHSESEVLHKKAHSQNLFLQVLQGFSGDQRDPSDFFRGLLF